MKITEQRSAAKNFLSMIVNGQIDEAYKKYVDLAGKHHNLFTLSGMKSLKEGMKENDDKFPNKKLIIKHIISEGDVVISHSHLVMKPNEEGMIVMHVLRFSNDKIVEMWDCGQVIPDKSLNTDGPF